MIDPQQIGTQSAGIENSLNPFVNSENQFGKEQRYSNQNNTFDSHKSIKKIKITKKIPELRVICLILRNEAHFLEEWLDFHFLTGWTKIALWDHNSTDHLKDILQKYPESLIDYEYVPWEKVGGMLAMINIQQEYYPKCFERYWQRAQVIGIFDVDEFVFPSALSWGAKDPLFDSFKNMKVVRNDSISMITLMECYKFGSISNETLIPTLESYTKRAAYTPDEENTITDLIQRSRPFCDNFWANPKCTSRGSHKALYFPNGQQHISINPSIHGPTNGRKGPTWNWFDSRPYRNTGFINCNHYFYRSFQEIKKKAIKNRSKHYQVISDLPPSHDYWLLYIAINDTLILDFIQSLESSKAFIEN